MISLRELDVIVELALVLDGVLEVVEDEFGTPKMEDRLNPSDVVEAADELEVVWAVGDDEEDDDVLDSEEEEEVVFASEVELVFASE